jgi:hypothetical protein
MQMNEGLNKRLGGGNRVNIVLNRSNHFRGCGGRGVSGKNWPGLQFVIQVRSTEAGRRVLAYTHEALGGAERGILRAPVRDAELVEDGDEGLEKGGHGGDSDDTCDGQMCEEVNLNQCALKREEPTRRGTYA